MEILRLPAINTEAIIEVESPNTEYEYSVLDLSDASTVIGTAVSNSNSKIVVPLSPLYDGDYRISVEGEDHEVTVVRPYVDLSKVEGSQKEKDEAIRNEAIARAIIDSVIDEGFYYQKRVVDMVGLGADYLPIWINAQKLLKIYENNVKIFDTADFEKYSIKYGLSEDKTAITIVYNEQINKAEAANLSFPMVASDLWDMKFGYRGFPKGFDYTIYLEAGYRKVPANIKRAAELLIDDISCNRLDYTNKYIKEYTTDQFKIKFDNRVFEGTGNMVVDKILSKYSKSIRRVGVL